MLCRFDQFFLAGADLDLPWPVGFRNFPAQEDSQDAISELRVVNFDIFGEPKCLGKRALGNSLMEVIGRILDFVGGHC